MSNGFPSNLDKRKTIVIWSTKRTLISLTYSVNQCNHLDTLKLLGIRLLFQRIQVWFEKHVHCILRDNSNILYDFLNSVLFLKSYKAVFTKQKLKNNKNGRKRNILQPVTKNFTFNKVSAHNYQGSNVIILHCYFKPFKMLF